MSYDKFNSGLNQRINSKDSNGSTKNPPSQSDKVRAEVQRKVNEVLNRKGK